LGKKIKKVIEKSAAAGIMPRDVLLNVMRKFYAAEEWTAAADIAAKVAPYYHPRLSATAVTIRKPSEMTNEELNVWLADATAAAALAEDPEDSRPAHQKGNGKAPPRH
jgi:hypothetical protein